VQPHCLGVQSLWVRLVSSLAVLPDPRVHLKQQRNSSNVTRMVWQQPHSSGFVATTTQTKGNLNPELIKQVAVQTNGLFLTHLPDRLAERLKLQSLSPRYEYKELNGRNFATIEDTMAPQDSATRWRYI
jgi:hypothetical protein